MKKETHELLKNNFLVIFVATATSLFANTLYNHFNDLTIPSFFPLFLKSFHFVFLIE